MPRLYTAILARNEASVDRAFRRVLAHCASFSDAVLVLDDGSTDATARVAAEHGAIARTRQARTAAWGHEAPARRELWEFAREYATGRNDWVLICDADMRFVGDPRELCQSEEVNAWSVILYDLWSETHYREDGFWQGHRFPRPWLFAPNRVPAGWVAEWPTRGIHCGHCPSNFPIVSGIAQQSTYYYLHDAYKSDALRRAKHAQYLSRAHQLSAFERQHAESILDADP